MGARTDRRMLPSQKPEPRFPASGKICLVVSVCPSACPGSPTRTKGPLGSASHMVDPRLGFWSFKGLRKTWKNCLAVCRCRAIHSHWLIGRSQACLYLQIGKWEDCPSFFAGIHDINWFMVIHSVLSSLLNRKFFIYLLPGDWLHQGREVSFSSFFAWGEKKFFRDLDLIAESNIKNEYIDIRPDAYILYLLQLLRRNSMILINKTGD